MSRVIYKYALTEQGVIVRGDNQKVVLTGIDYNNDPSVWVELHHPLADAHHDAVPQQRVQYLIMGTGWNMEDDESFHVGSYISPGGFVWHVYGKKLP